MTPSYVLHLEADGSDKSEAEAEAQGISSLLCSSNMSRGTEALFVHKVRLDAGESG
eukprot:CAMPEP_0203936154 /NCGR_PEP_ID=MMETSP0359-20131031/73767_1 /ASSEMBLY_ACC=CAM_ASM_000338 /TAXON_ID=268821 /ORGANISM="Scrippsiella Hangoei, Strain SHTV-5" /LENGTH=55 /DNA_ID=CAMNT_0050866089 /DNA_START=130 /DNA_END=294 /DNA_ORIENTATION=+